MHRWAFYFLLMIFGLATQSALSQEQYRSSKLREIAQLLKQHNRPAIIERDSTSGIVTHIGLPIYSAMETEYPYNVIVRFAQRYGLYASLLNDRERRIVMSADRVTFDVKALCKIDTIRSSSFDMTNRTIYATLNGVNLSFPNDWQLLTGMNKIECEQYFYNSLMAFAHKGSSTANDVTQVEPTSPSSYYKQEGECYLIKEINQDKYYVKLANDSIRPIYSSNYPSETLSNLMQNLVTSNFNLCVEQQLYGFKSRTFTVPLSVFMEYCSQQHCKAYVGIESETMTNLTAIVVYRNPVLMYNHLLCIDMDKDVLNKQDGVINAYLYCYIPTHNLKNLF